MEQFVELLAGALANRAEAAKKAAGQAQRGAPPPVKGPSAPVPAAPVRRTSPAPAPRAPAPPVRSPAPFDGGSDDFGSVFETTSVAEVAAGPRSPLLAAFAGGGGLLAGLILSEALAPPVALRPHRTER